jgi:hypothetical protein
VTVARRRTPARGRTCGRPDERVGRSVLQLPTDTARAEVIKVMSLKPAISPGVLVRTRLNKELLGASPSRRTQERSPSRSTSRPRKEERGSGELVAGAMSWSRTSAGVLRVRSWDELRAVNEKLIYCAISGFGQSGPMARAAGVRPDHPRAVRDDEWTGTPETAPPRRIPVCDTLGGLAAACPSPHAGRVRTGRGCASTSRPSRPRSRRWAADLELRHHRRRAAGDGERELHGALSGAFARLRTI